MSYEAVRNYVQRVAGTDGGPTPIPGSSTWCALADDNPAKAIAVLTAGTRWCLEQELAALDERRHALKDAALAVSMANDWSAAARRIRDRDAFMKANPDWAVRRPV